MSWSGKHEVSLRIIDEPEKWAGRSRYLGRDGTFWRRIERRSLDAPVLLLARSKRDVGVARSYVGWLGTLSV